MCVWVCCVCVLLCRKTVLHFNRNNKVFFYLSKTYCTYKTTHKSAHGHKHTDTRTQNKNNKNKRALSTQPR